MGEDNNKIGLSTSTTPTHSPSNSGSSTSPMTNSCSPNSNVLIINGTNSADYLAQLIKDRSRLAAFPNVFVHIQRLIDNEIKRVRDSLFHMDGVEKKPLLLPEAEGPIVQQQEKVYVPVKDYPDYNFVGRILGPRGMTAKQLEQETGCKVMVRGRGSMRDKKKEEQNRGKPNWEHLNDELHVLITVEDSANRAALKMERAVEEIKKLLIPVTDGEDELKKRQLMELAIINGTYRDSSTKNCMESEHMKLLAPPVALTTPMRTHTATSLGAPLIFSPRHIHVPTSSALLNGSGPPPLITPADAGFLYAPYDFHQYAALTSPLLAEYPVTQQGDTTSSDPYYCPMMQVDSSGAIQLVLQDSNLMCTGLTSKGAAIMAQEFPHGTFLSINSDGKQHQQHHQHQQNQHHHHHQHQQQQHALTVGPLKMSSPDIPNKMIKTAASAAAAAIENVHYHDDGHWRVKSSSTR